MKKYILVCLTILVSCRPCARPDLYLPIYYTEGEPNEYCTGHEPEVDLQSWWNSFRDPLLSYLVGRALTCNYDLRIAREKICEARGVYRLEFSTLLPHVDAFALFNRMRNSQTLAETPFLGGKFTNFYQAGFDASWELDLFGKNRAKTCAAAYDVAAACETVRDVHVTVAAEVARTYFIIRTIQGRIEIIEKHIEAEKNLTELSEDRLRAGLISGLDFHSSKALLEARLAELPRLHIQLYQTIYSLGILLGMLPENLLSFFCESHPLPCIEGKIPLGLPSELLCRRGDIRSAEYAMRAAGARVISARKEMFPTLSLEGLFSYATGFFTQWLKGASRQWSITPSLVLPIFHGGEILAHISIQTSLQHQAVLTYEKKVIAALQEVESALAGYFREGARLDALKREIAEYREARDIAQTLYLAGKVDFLNVIQREKDLFIAEMVHEESKENLFTYLVAVYKALGGGWECCTMR